MADKDVLHPAGPTGPAPRPWFRRMDLATPSRLAPTAAIDDPTAPAAAGNASLRLAGTSALASIDPTDARLVALRRACALLESLEAERRALDLRLEAARRTDPMRQVSGRTSLDAAVEETRSLIRELDEALSVAAESARLASTTHPKDCP